jgi:hypothetical protein
VTSPRGYDAGTAILQITPVFRGVQEGIERQLKGVERALGKKGEESGREFGEGLEKGVAPAVDRVLGTDTAKKAAKKAGEAYAGAFSTEVKRAVADAQREIRATIKLTGDDKELQRTLRGISNEFNKIAKAKIGIDMDAETVLGNLVKIQAEIKAIQKDASKIDLGFNSAAAQVGLEAIEKRIDKLSKVNIEVEVDERKMGLFEKAVKRRLKAAVENIPPVDFDANVTPAMNKVQQLRHEMNTLLDKRIGIDLDGSAVLTEMEKIRTALIAVGGDRTLDVAVRTDAASAAKELAQIRALVDLVDGSTAEVNVKIDSQTTVSKLEQLREKLIGVDHAGRSAADSFRSFNAVILGGAFVLPAFVPALTAAVGALALLGPAGAAAAAGLGVLIFGFSGVGDAVKALGEEGPGAADKVAEAFNKLGPAGQRFATFLNGLRGQMRALRDEVQGGLLPGVETGIQRILSVNGPLLQTFMRNMGSTLGNLFKEFGTLMTSPQWQGLWATFNEYAPTFVQQFGQVAMSMLTFFGELFQGLAPYAERFGDVLVNLAADTADWMALFTNSPTFTSIMDWLFTNGPIIFEHIWSIVRAAGNLLVALEPLGMLILGVLGHIADFIAAMDPDVLGAVVTTFLGLVVAFQLASGAVALLSGTFTLLQGTLSKMVFFFGAAATALVALYANSEPVRAFFDWLIGIIGDVVGWFLDLPTPILAFATALGAIVLLRGPLGGVLTTLRNVFETMALKAIYATEGVGGLQKSLGGLGVGGVVTKARSALGSFTSFLGGPWGIALGAATVGLTLLFEVLGESNERTRQAEDYQRDLAAALRESKGAIDDNVRALAAQRAAETEVGGRNLLQWARDLGIALPDVTDALLGNEGAARRVRGAIEELIQAEILRGQTLNQGSGAEAQEIQNRITRYRDLLEAFGGLTPAMQAVLEKEGLLEEATGGAASAEERLAAATERVNSALAVQNEHMLKLAEAEFAFRQSMDSLADANARVAEAQEALNAARVSGDPAAIAAAEERLAQALSAQETQAFSTANQSRRLAEARFSLAEGNELALLSDALMLENLREQERLYGALPPELQALKDGLEQTVPAAYTAAVQMSNLGLAVESIPSDKTIVISGDTPQTQLDTLRDLGLEIVTLEDGSFAVTANTDEAQEILDAFLAQDLGIEIGASVRWETEYDRARRASSGLNGENTGGGYATGGYVRGPGTPTSDSIPAWLSNGEYVINAASVQKYGLGLLHMINAGKYALGGLVKAGRRKFAGGGLAATWGGTMSLTGGDTNPLAQIWFEAIQAINMAAAAGAAVISAQFASMRDRVLGTIRDLRTRTLYEFAPLVRGVVAQATTMRTLVDRQILTMSLNAVRTFTGMRTTLNRLTLDLSLAQVRTFTGMRTAVEATVNAMVGAIGTHFARLPRTTATPVNAVIDQVLNRGLFRAFNQIVLELGLNKEWTIAAAPGVQLAQTGGGTRLATGGRVPGHSPNDKADNIPAWLTAGEWVHPVDAVRYYGSDLMEKIRRRKIPREQLAHYADGGDVQRRATGGQIFAKTLTAFPRAKLNSGYRPGDPGYHGRDMAADMGEAGFSGGIGRAYIAAMKRWWVDTFGRTAQEIIYNGLGNDRTNINNGAPYPYSAATQAEHRNHLHVAYAGVLAGATGGPGVGGVLPGIMIAPPAWFSKYGDANGVLKVLQESVKAADKLTAYGKPGKMYDSMADKAVEYVWSKAKPQVETLFAGMAGQLAGAIAGASGATGPIVDIVRSVASKYGWGSGNEWNSLAKLIEKESSWRNTAQNPTSTAYGLFQFLNSTWAGVGGYKTSDPGLQTEFGLRYIKGRYGSPSQALAFHLANNWYSEGGEVSPEGNADAPTLYDTGGWLPPGLTTVLNATNKPEPILTSQQWAELTGSREEAVPGSVIGNLHLHQVQNNLESAVAEVNHWARKYDRGGRYSPVGGAR